MVAKAPPEVEVPDVVDQQRDAARRRCARRASRSACAEETVDTLDQDGIVIDQDPAGGDAAATGSRVTIVVGRFDRRRPRADAHARADATPEPTP